MNMLQTRFVFIVLFVILPLVTSWIVNLGANRIHTAKTLRRQREFIIRCCGGYLSCYSGSGGRMRTVTAANANKASTISIIEVETTIAHEAVSDDSSNTDQDPDIPTVKSTSLALSKTTLVVKTDQPKVSSTASAALTATVAPSSPISSPTKEITSTSTPTATTISIITSTPTGIATFTLTSISIVTTTMTLTSKPTVTTTIALTSKPIDTTSSTSTIIALTSKPIDTITSILSSKPIDSTTSLSTTMTLTSKPIVTTIASTTSTFTSTSATSAYVSTATTIMDVSTPTTTSTTPCPNSCRTSDCFAANNSMKAALNSIPSPTLSPSSWPLDTLNGKKYYVERSISVALSWYAAQAECMKHGMELATIGSQAEQDAINNHIQAIGLGGAEFFIGGNKMGTQCFYVWDNGEPMTYTNWNAGNPAQQSTEECMTWVGGKWDDYPCQLTRWFICEEVGGTTTTTKAATTTSTTTSTTPCSSACRSASCLASKGLKTAAIDSVPSTTLSPSSLSLATIAGNNYYLEKTSKTWYDALAFCMKYGMTLASLESQAETDAVNSYLKSPGMPSDLVAFLSGNKIGGQCSYGWESGVPMTYTNWGPGNPAEATSEECMVWWDNKWGDLPCDWTRWFLCEQKP